MHETNIRSLDLNLLVALKALLEEKHVTRAAERVGLSQPAMSRALGRLRHLLKDPLLVRADTGLSLTVRASDLIQPLQAIFIEINHIISPPSADPATMQGEITIATRDYEMVAILPKLIERLTREAPGLMLRVIPLQGDNLSVLERQEADFVISASESTAANFYRQTLYEEDFICLVSAKNPIAKQTLTLKKYLSLKHCLVTITGFGPGMIDTLLAQQGLHRTVAVRVPHFLAAASIVAESDLIVTVPRKLGAVVSQQQRIVILKPPLKIPSFFIYAYWHLRNQNNPQHKWVRNVLRDIYKK